VASARSALALLRKAETAADPSTALRLATSAWSQAHRSTAKNRLVVKRQAADLVIELANRAIIDGDNASRAQAGRALSMLKHNFGGRMKNPKKGAMPRAGVQPPALKKYWATRRRAKKSVRDPAHKRLVKSLSSHFASDEAILKRRRRKNPTRAFRLIIRKGTQSLYLSKVGDKFVSSGLPRRFSTVESARTSARDLANRFAVLKGWTFYAKP